MNFFSQGKKKVRMIATGVEPMTIRLLARMLYHRAMGDLWYLGY